jgi:RecB family exonuclease
MIMQWSYSRLSGYEQCPLKMKFKVIDKLPDPAGPAAERGVYWHKVAENFVRGVISELPDAAPGDPPMHSYKPLFAAIGENKPLLEHQVGFTREWTETGFFAKDTWGRAVYDVIWYDEPTRTVKIIDWKTGKPNVDHMSQLELYSATGLLLFPEAEQAHSQDQYLDVGPHSTLDHKLKRDRLPVILESWKKRVERMEADKQFAPRPGNHCKWCTFAKKKGGQCSFG